MHMHMHIHMHMNMDICAATKCATGIRCRLSQVERNGHPDTKYHIPSNHGKSQRTGYGKVIDVYFIQQVIALMNTVTDCRATVNVVPTRAFSNI